MIPDMPVCKHCGKAIIKVEDGYIWVHFSRRHTFMGDLCYPEKGFAGSTAAEPGPEAA